MSESGRDPVFIHSLHRSGSTYIFNAFRRVTNEGAPCYTCFQEPIHEIALNARHNPDVLLTFEGSGSAQQVTRHPQLEKPYFQELYDVYSAWRDAISPDIVYSDYFGGAAASATSAYLRAIIEAAPNRPIIQECRTPLRMRILKEHLGGTHVFLWRNPWDQWWSLKATDYFDTVHQLILNAPGCPPVISRLKEYIDFVHCKERSISSQFLYYGLRRPSAEASYLTYYTLYMLALMEATRSADFLINIDKLSSDLKYRDEILGWLKTFRIQGVDFSDCSVAQAPYDNSDARFFEPLERRVLGWLKETGHESERIARVQRLREENAPLLVGRARISRFSIEVGRLRSVLIRMENREATSLRVLNERGAAQRSELVSLSKRVKEAEGGKAELESRLAAEREANKAANMMAAREVKKIHAQAERDRQALAKLIDLFEAERTFWRTELEAAVSRAEAIETANQALRNRLADSEQNKLTWEQKAHEWWTIAERTSRELRDVYASRSWRITRSYRQFGGLVRRRLDLHGRLSAQALPRAMVRAVALALLSFARRHHWAKVWIRTLVSRFPRLEKHLLLFALHHSPTAQAAPQVENEQSRAERNMKTPRRRKKIFDSRVTEIVSKISK